MLNSLKVKLLSFATMAVTFFTVIVLYMVPWPRSLAPLWVRWFLQLVVLSYFNLGMIYIHIQLSVKFCPFWKSAVTLLLLFGREASGKREVHVSSPGGPLPQFVFLEFGAWRPFHLSVMLPQSNPSRSFRAEWVVRITKWALFQLRVSWSYGMLVFQVFSFTPSPDQ